MTEDKNVSSLVFDRSGTQIAQKDCDQNKDKQIKIF